MMSQQTRRFVAFAVFVALVVLTGSDAAFASTDVLSFMTGTFATTAATVAVAAVGYLALTSRIPWMWAFSVVIGVALIFGAAQVVSSLTSGMGGG